MKYINKIMIPVFFAILLVLSQSPASYAKSNAIKVSVDGKYLSLDTPPTVIKGRTLVPLRAIFDALKADTKWYSSNKTILATKGNIKIVLQIGNKYSTINGVNQELDVPPTIINGRTLVPTRFIAESLRSDVKWDSSTRTVIITSKKFDYTVVSFADKNLEAAVRQKVKKTTGNLYKGDLEFITDLTASKKKITSIEGIQHLPRLKTLDLTHNEIIEISPLSTLTELNKLYLFNNKISNLQPLGNLTNLDTLYLSSNIIGDISPLSKLSKLTKLDLYNNSVMDINPLSNLKELKELRLFDNIIYDITPLQNLTKLTTLKLEGFDKVQKLDEALINKYKQIKDTAVGIVNSVVTPGMSELDKELALHDYLVTMIDYDFENYKKDKVPDESHNIEGVFLRKTAVCDGYAKAFKLLLNLAGIECMVVEGDSNSFNSWELHAWNIVKIGGVYYQVDPTWNDPVQDDGTQDSLVHSYFNLSDTQMATKHKWDRRLFPKCTTDNTSLSIFTKSTFTVSGDWFYTNYVSNKLSKVKIDGSQATKLSDDEAQYINVYDGFVYYKNKTDKLIYKMKTDGSERMIVSNDNAEYLYVVDGYIFYINPTDDKIYKLDTRTGTKTSLSYDKDLVSWMAVVGDKIYYKAYNNNNGGTISYTDFNGGTKLYIVDSASGFRKEGGYIYFNYDEEQFVSGEWLYYSNERDGSKLYKIKLNGSENTKLNDEKTILLNMVDNWLYYKTDEKSDTIIRIKADGSSRQTLPHN